MLQPYFSNDPTVSYCDILYTKKEAYSEIIWELLKAIPSSKQHVLIIGHNPGLTDFYNSLSVPNYDFIHFPTLGVATIQFYEQANWGNMNTDSAIERNICCA
jgi:phosphohistidine phosphatase SixA